MDYDFMILNSPFLVHHPGIKTRKMGNEAKKKDLETAQNSFIYNHRYTQHNSRYNEKVNLLKKDLS